ncbi:MAG: flippase [Patescibacteria group bacterium]
MSDRVLAKNTTFYASALALQKALSFVYFIFVARFIGVENNGKYSFALSFTTVFAIFLDFGLTQILIRETSRDPNNTQKYLANIMALKLAGSFLIYGIIVAAVNLMGYPELTRHLVYVSGVVMLIDSFSLTFFGVFRGHQNLRFESLGVIINQLIVLACGLGVLILGLGLVPLIGVYLLGSGFNFLYSAAVLKKKFNLFPRLAFDYKIIRNLLLWSLPFAIAGIFSRLYSSMDIILLSKLTNDHAVGIYSVAYKVAFALQFVALAFSASIYPAFCNYYAHSKEKLADLFTKSMHYLMILALPLSFGLVAIADKIIGPVFGHQYDQAVLPLQILMTSMIFIFVCFPIGAMLNACDKQARNTINLGIVAAFNVIANLVLIPYYSFVGSAIANFLSYLLLFILGITVVGKIVDYNKKHLIITLIKILVGCIAMSLVVIGLKSHLHFVLVILLGILVYFAIIYLLKVIAISSAKDFVRSFLSKK